MDLSNFVFHICGDRWDKFVDKYKGDVDIKHTEYIDYHRMPEIYNSFDYLLVPTDFDKDENGPMVLLEALACGVPVITTNVGYAGEFNVSVFNSIDELVCILKKINEQYTSQVVNYTWDNFRSKHIELFKKLYYENTLHTNS